MFYLLYCINNLHTYPNISVIFMFSHIENAMSLFKLKGYMVPKTQVSSDQADNSHGHY